MPNSVFPGMRAPIGWFRGHVHSMYSFCNAVYNGVTPSPSFEDGAYVNTVMQAAYKSDEQHREVKL